jgi:hypothetical protein
MKPIIGLLALAVVAVGAYLLGTRPGEGPRGATTRIASPSTPTPNTAPGHASMDEATFWRLIADTRAAAGDDTARQSDLLGRRLGKLPARQIVDFQRIRHRMDQRAYTWDLWGAAYVIEDGCSDDCFRDFRAYLISLGRGPYEAALRDPDSLGPIVQDAEHGGWENADSVAADAYENATGKDIPDDESDQSGDPRGEAWDDEDQEALIQRYPHLAARFR